MLAERRIAQRLLVELNRLAASSSEWRAKRSPGRAYQAAGSARFDAALSLADDVERTGRQRHLEVDPDSLEELLELRLKLYATPSRRAGLEGASRPALALERGVERGGRAQDRQR